MIDVYNKNRSIAGRWSMLNTIMALSNYTLNISPNKRFNIDQYIWGVIFMDLLKIRLMICDILQS